jgi:hypothetical protein
VETMPKMISLNGFIDKDFACAFVTDAQDWAIY